MLQLCFYSEGVGQVQGSPPPLAHLELGSGLRETIRLREVAPYFRRARAAFEEAARSDRPTSPYPCEHCGFCGFRRECEERWLAEDHLTRVAWISRAQVDALSAGGVATRGGLAALPPATTIADVRPATLANLHQQARLQVEADTAQQLPYELLPLESERGFARLPDPSPGDVMFDLEGDPLWTPSRELTFLFGLLLAEGDGWRYEPVWAHSLDDERRAFQRVIDLIADRLEAYPDMHVYHYSPAEPGALQRLMADHATRELEVDDLLRRKVMVDLLTVVRQAMRVGVESYSLKRIEHLAGFRREAEMGSGADAVLGYERWVESRDDAELDAIARYNDEDCRATLALRDWLVSIRPHDAARLEPIARKDIGADRGREEATAREALRLDLVTGAEPGSVRWLAGELLEYHRREARPGWWRYFSLLDMDGEELIADAEAIGGLEPTGPPVPRPNKMFEVPLRFPPQQHKLEAGSLVDPDAEKAVTVSEIDNDACTAVVRAQTVRGRAAAAGARAARADRQPRASRGADAAGDGGARLARPLRGAARGTGREPAAIRGSTGRRTDPDDRSGRAAGARARARPQLPARAGAARHRQDVHRRAADRRPDRARPSGRCDRAQPQGDQQAARGGRARCRRAWRALPRSAQGCGSPGGPRSRRRPGRERREERRRASTRSSGSWQARRGCSRPRSSTRTSTTS